MATPKTVNGTELERAGVALAQRVVKYFEGNDVDPRLECDMHVELLAHKLLAVARRDKVTGA